MALRLQQVAVALLLSCMGAQASLQLQNRSPLDFLTDGWVSANQQGADSDGSLDVEVRSTRLLLQSNSTSAASPGACSCNQDALVDADALVQDLGYFGALPSLKHATYLYQQLMRTRGQRVRVTNNVEQFASPADLTPVTKLYAPSDLSTIEKRVTGAPTAAASGNQAKMFFQPPPWVTAWPTATVDEAAAAAALNTLVYQAANLSFFQPVTLLYRRDILDAQGLPVPETWQQLLQVAALINGTDMNDDNVTDFALCLDVDPGCRLYWVFSTVAASILQVRGTVQGYLIDPVTGQYPIRSDGMMAALRLWARLLQYNSPEESSKGYCGIWDDAFAQGRCAFTLSANQINSHNTQMRSSTVTGKLYSWGRTGAAPTPGSTVVFERASGTMVNCTPMICPYATPATTTLPSTTVPASGIRTGAQAQVQTPQQQYVNRAPVIVRSANQEKALSCTRPACVALYLFEDAWIRAGTAWFYLAFDPAFIMLPSNQRLFANVGLDFTNLDWASVDAAYYNSSSYATDLYRWLLQFQNRVTWSPSSVQTAASAGSGSGNTTDAHNSSGDSTANSKLLRSVPWTGIGEFLGLEQREVLNHIALAVFLATHPNSVPDPQMTSPLRITVASMASQFSKGVSEALILQDLDYKLGLWALEPASFWTLEGYQADLGYVPPSPPAPPRPDSTSRPPSEHGDQPDAKAQTVAIAVPISIASGLLAVLIGFAYYVRRSKAGLDVFGKVRAPGLGPATSLLVTDIQNSTLLWEKLPADVMDHAMQLHHAVLRDHLLQHKGYETCTEGDSFIIAFHTPTDALQYCMAVQEALLSAPWPQELLDAADVIPDVADIQLQYGPETMAWCEDRSLLSYMRLPASRRHTSSTTPPPLCSWRRLLCCRWPPLSIYSPNVRWSGSGSGSGPSLGNPGTFATDTSGESTHPSLSSDYLIAGWDAHGVAAVLDQDDTADSEALGRLGPELLGEVVIVPDSDAAEAPGARALGTDRVKAGTVRLTLAESAGLGDEALGTVKVGTDAAAEGRRSLRKASGSATKGVPAKADSARSCSSLPSHSSNGPGVLRPWSPQSAISVPQHSASPSKAAQSSGRQTQQPWAILPQEAVQRGTPPWQEGDTLQSWLSRQVYQVNCASGSSDCTQTDVQALAVVVALRGLRVRMGLHAGLTDPHSWSVNQATGRWCASGPVLATLKAVGDAGTGGMVLLSRAFWKSLQPFGAVPDCLVLHMGEHQLKEQEGSAPLYLAISKALICRLAVFPAVRTLGLTSPTLMRAPMGQAVVVFMNAIGIGALRAWNAEVTRDALHIYQEVVTRALLEWGGYLVELADGLCLAAFADPAAAVNWTLCAQADLLTQDWDPRMLRHDLCEEVAVNISVQATPMATAAGDPSATAGLAPAALFEGAEAATTATRAKLQPGRSMLLDKDRPKRSHTFTMTVRKKILLRGLRVKAGIDIGEVHCHINPSTGRMAYMGKAMNRAARIAAYATSGQVLCSMQAWTARCTATALHSATAHAPTTAGLSVRPMVLGTSLGPHSLKGISDKVHIVHCTLEDEL